MQQGAEGELHVGARRRGPRRLGSTSRTCRSRAARTSRGWLERGSSRRREQVGHGISALTMAMPMTVAVFWLAAAPGLAPAFASGRHWPTVADAAVVFRASPLALRGPLALQASPLALKRWR